MSEILEYVGDLPNISGSEPLIEAAIRERPDFLYDNGINFDRISSACAIALHMQQPLIPAGGHDLQTAEIISNLKYMMDHQEIGDIRVRCSHKQSD